MKTCAYDETFAVSTTFESFHNAFELPAFLGNNDQRKVSQVRSELHENWRKMRFTYGI